MLANVTFGPYTVNNQAIGTSSENLFATHVLTSVRPEIVHNVSPQPDMVSGLIGLSM